MKTHLTVGSLIFLGLFPCRADAPSTNSTPAASSWLGPSTTNTPAAVTTAPAPGELPGMEQEIHVKVARDLGIFAASGNKVAVLDQNIDPGAPKLQDHHNGWLALASTVGGLDGTTVKVKGKYYIPSTATTMPKSLRMTIRARSKAGLVVLVDKSIKLDGGVDKWVDFELDLPVVNPPSPPPAPAAADAKVVLMLSALDFAGPVYLDTLQVTGAQGATLWAYPDFE